MMQRQFSVKDHVDFFPFDVLGAMNPSNNVDKNYRVKTITLHTDAGFDIETDIVEKTFVFRNRSMQKGSTRYMSDKNVKPGDIIIIQKITPYEYNMKLKREG
jgi:hydrogenase maturation factor